MRSHQISWHYISAKKITLLLISHTLHPNAPAASLPRKQPSKEAIRKAGAFLTYILIHVDAFISLLVLLTPQWPLVSLKRFSCLISQWWWIFGVASMCAGLWGDFAASMYLMCSSVFFHVWEKFLWSRSLAVILHDLSGMSNIQAGKIAEQKHGGWGLGLNGLNLSCLTTRCCPSATS